MDRNYCSQPEEMEIDLMDLIMTLLSRWKSIILIAVICTLIGGAVGVLKSGDTAEEEEEEDILTEEELQAQYEVLKAEYEVELKLYLNRQMWIDEYESSVDDLIEATDKLEEIPEDETGERTAALINISTLQQIVSNARTMVQTYRNAARPEIPETYEEFLEEKSEETAEEEKEDGNFGAMAKYAVIGFVLGGFLGCCLWGGLYILDGKVKTDADVAAYGVNILGTPDKADFAAANVRNFISDDIKSILVTGSIDRESVTAVADAVRRICGDGIEVMAAEGLNDNADTAMLLAGADAAVLVEKAKKSRIKDVSNEIMMVRNAGKALIGATV